MSTLPLTFPSPDWYTLSFIAERMGKNRRTVQYWVERGLFTRMGIQVIVVPAKRHCGRSLTWVRIPNNGKYAMFNRIHFNSVDSSSNSPIPSQ